MEAAAIVAQDAYLKNGLDRPTVNKDDQWQALVKDLWAAYIRMYGFPADGPNVKHAPEWRELWGRTEALWAAAASNDANG